MTNPIDAINDRDLSHDDMKQAEAHYLEGHQGLPYLVIVRTDQTIVDAYGPVNAIDTKDALSKTVTSPKRVLNGHTIDVYPLGITLDGQIERETYNGDDDD